MVAVCRQRSGGTSPITSGISQLASPMPIPSVLISHVSLNILASLLLSLPLTPQPPNMIAFEIFGATTIEWPERGEGPSFLIWTLCQLTSPSFCGARQAVRQTEPQGGGGRGEGIEEGARVVRALASAML